MVIKCQTGLTEFCDAAKWQFCRADDSKYTFGEALGDLTGVGAIFNLGANVAVMDRNQRMLDWIRGIDSKQMPEAERLIGNTIHFFETKNNSLQKSILSKIAYVGSLTLALVGGYYSSTLRNVGLVGSLGLGAYFMGKAGFDGMDRSMELRGEFLSLERMKLANQLGVR
jgi:hypothetical protein